jgi:hypothetical protein
MTSTIGTPAPAAELDRWDSSARSTVEVVAEELGHGATKATRSQN